MPDIRITSDTHLGHAKVAELRGFRDIQHHDDTILRNLAKGTHENTVTWFAGDMVFGSPARKLELLERIRTEVRGDKRLVLGNHDPIHPGVKANADWSAWTQTFSQIHMAAKINHNGAKLMLSHFPYDGDNDNRTDGRADDRFEQWRLRDLGRVLLHGHTHSDEVVSFSWAGTLQIHVGLDAHRLKPVHISTIAKIIADNQ